MSSLGKNGRFGNQIFQYAFLKVYARRHHVKVEVPHWIGNYLFGHHDSPILKKLPVVKQISWQLHRDHIPNAKTPFKNVDLSGYFQYHTKYYAPDKEYFRSLFKLVEPIQSKMDRAVQLLRKQGKTVVGLHLRRGDYGIKYFFIAPTSWYKEWLNQAWKDLENPVLFIASDEPAKVLPDFKEYKPITSKDLGLNLPKAEYYPDFYLLSQCDITAISNSSYSFAASMLNEQGKQFVRPHLPTKKLIPYNPWNSEVLLRDESKSS